MVHLPSTKPVVTLQAIHICTYMYMCVYMYVYSVHVRVQSRIFDPKHERAVVKYPNIITLLV